MSRQSLRLMSSICLSAFLFANTPVGLASCISACFQEECAAGCCACCCQQESEDPEGLAIASDEDCPTCPFCPNCLGGCAYCNASKVPCCLALVQIGQPVLLPGEHVCESPLLAPQSCSAELIHPPRV